MKLPKDIFKKITEDFSNSDDRELVKNLLGNLEVSEAHRIMRCILYLADGDLKALGLYKNMAKIDYRDVIMNAEYEYPSGKRLRDFTEPFRK